MPDPKLTCWYCRGAQLTQGTCLLRTCIQVNQQVSKNHPLNRYLVPYYDKPYDARDMEPWEVIMEHLIYIGKLKENFFFLMILKLRATDEELG